MNQCVPNWDLDEAPNPPHGLPLHPSRAAAVASQDIPTREEYEVAELTWVNGHPSMNGLGGPIRMGKPDPKFAPAAWEKGGGTLESVVDQATGALLLPAEMRAQLIEYDLVPWIAAHHYRADGGEGSAKTAADGGVTMDALVPCSKRRSGVVSEEASRVPEPAEARLKMAGEGGNCSGSGSGGGEEDQGLTTSTSPVEESPETDNTAVPDEHDSAVHSQQYSKGDGGVSEEEKKKTTTTGDVVRSSVSTKRSRAAAVHNQSERKRRDRINQRMKTLQKLVPNSSKTDKASMLDEVIDYLRQLQAQVQMMSKMNTMAAPPLMMAMPMHHQMQQMAMMAQMAQMAQMGMMAMGVDMNPLARSQPQTPSTPMLHPSPFLPLPFPAAPSWDGGDPQPAAHGGAPPLPLVPDPFSVFMACQPQMPMNMDAFNRMVMAMYQQHLFQQQPSPQNPNPGK